jgi:hypothetical protein
MPPWIAFVVIPGAIVGILVSLPFVAQRIPWTLPRSVRVLVIFTAAAVFLVLTRLGEA